MAWCKRLSVFTVIIMIATVNAVITNV